ncbi:hypothetical protein OUZ56_019623 [Daphnia magna]|uniref:Uncharacterized protein n=1 Tax=Daphnia magna TaxID=35525 RepID=A0ABQ9ZD57_9CRUS|nr:hypothetical protein OUZ56_019623 [Daphnia magna]
MAHKKSILGHQRSHCIQELRASKSETRFSKCHCSAMSSNLLAYIFSWRLQRLWQVDRQNKGPIMLTNVNILDLFEVEILNADQQMAQKKLLTAELNPAYRSNLTVDEKAAAPIGSKITRKLPVSL